MTDSKGPYRVENQDGSAFYGRVVGPTGKSVWGQINDARTIARDLNNAHHTARREARREAIEECIKIVAEAANGRHPFVIESCNRIETALRALLGAGENKQAKEPDRGDE